MSDMPLQVAVVVASTRTGRFGETVGRWFVTRAQQHDDLAPATPPRRPHPTPTLPRLGRHP